MAIVHSYIKLPEARGSHLGYGILSDINPPFTGSNGFVLGFLYPSVLPVLPLYDQQIGNIKPKFTT